MTQNSGLARSRRHSRGPRLSLLSNSFLNNLSRWSNNSLFLVPSVLSASSRYPYERRSTNDPTSSFDHSASSHLCLSLSLLHRCYAARLGALGDRVRLGEQRSPGELRRRPKAAPHPSGRPARPCGLAVPSAGGPPGQQQQQRRRQQQLELDGRSKEGGCRCCRPGCCGLVAL